MCLVLLSYKQHSRFPLVLAANRDEFTARPTAPAGFWAHDANILGGRDLKQGGSWLCLAGHGRWAALTNVREPSRYDPKARSRGDLVYGYVAGAAAPEEYAEGVLKRGDSYNGFNLLLADANSLIYVSNRVNGISTLSPGLYGLSNAALDSPWPKVVKGKQLLHDALQSGADGLEARLFRLLSDEARAGDDALPQTGVELEIERALSPLRIQMSGYATRSSSIVMIEENGLAHMIERTFNEGGQTETRRFQIDRFTR